jgi:hypothetical protein
VPKPLRCGAENSDDIGVERGDDARGQPRRNAGQALGAADPVEPSPPDPNKEPP